jgi:beta-glucosidase
MSFPVNVGQIPISYDELPTGRRFDQNNEYTSRYLDVGNAPQYPFGYGLSTADVTNTGSVAGDDVVQLYTHEDGTSLLQPVRKLEGFQRITVLPGQTKTVMFRLGRQNLGFYKDQGQFVVEPGTVQVYVGGSSTCGHGSYDPGTHARVLIAIRFQALIVTIRLTSAAISSELNWVAKSS